MRPRIVQPTALWRESVSGVQIVVSAMRAEAPHLVQGSSVFAWRRILLTDGSARRHIMNSSVGDARESRSLMLTRSAKSKRRQHRVPGFGGLSPVRVFASDLLPLSVGVDDLRPWAA